MARSKALTRTEDITRAILVLRGYRVILDAELAALYSVPTKALNQAVKRNAERFPDDFMFRLSRAEIEALNRSQSVTGSQKHRDPRSLPLAFTEHGAIMAATVLNSPRAVEMSVYVVRAFVKLRELLASNKDLARKLAALERSLVALDLKTQRQFKGVYAAIRALMSAPAPKRRPIGFTADLGREIGGRSHVPAHLRGACRLRSQISARGQARESHDRRLPCNISHGRATHSRGKQGEDRAR